MFSAPTPPGRAKATSCSSSSAPGSAWLRAPSFRIMDRPRAARRLVVNADDFGRSHGINEAVLRAHREGILTTASLMMNEEATDEAVQLARDNPRLGVGLHLTLLCGHSALTREEIPGLLNRSEERRVGKE